MSSSGRAYYELLKDPRWQRLRQQIISRDEHRCVTCDSDAQEIEGDYLAVHHGYYWRGVMPWDYPHESLHTLCRGCHEESDFQRYELYKQSGKLEPVIQVQKLTYLAMGLYREREKEMVALGKWPDFSSLLKRG